MEKIPFSVLYSQDNWQTIFEAKVIKKNNHLYFIENANLERFWINEIQTEIQSYSQEEYESTIY